MGSDKTSNDRFEETIIHVSHLATGEMLVIFLTWFAFIICLIIIFLSDLPGNICFYLFALIGTLWFLYYLLKSKSIYVFEEGISGPFFELNNLVIKPFKTRYYVPFEKVLKIEFNYYKRTDGYNTIFSIGDTHFEIGLKNSEAIKLTDIMRRIQPDIPIEVKHKDDSTQS